MNKPKKYLSIDIETDGLDASKIWCLVVTDKDTRESVVFTHNGELGYKDVYKDFVPYIADLSSQFDIVYIGFNIVSFDLIKMKKLIKGFTYRLPEGVLDCFILSQLLNQEREGGHSLKAWGLFLGNQKQDFHDWSKLTQEMIDYCIQDTIVAIDTFKHLQTENKGFSLETIYLEHNIMHVCTKMEEHGHLLDVKKAELLLAETTQACDTIAYNLKVSKPKIPKLVGLVKFERTKPTKKDPQGKIYSRCLKPLGEDFNPDDLVGDYSRIEWLEFSVGSRQQCVYQLLLQGWKPTKFSEKTGAPVFDGDTIDELVQFFPECKDIGEFFLIDKRRGYIKSWIEAADENGRVHGRINPIGCRTHRAAHSNPNKGQIAGSQHDPKTGALLRGRDGSYSAECREVWVAPKGYKHVGVDASAIQLVILAHALGSSEYAEAVAKGDKKKGTDVHTINRNTLREAAKEILKCDDDGVAHIDRDRSKTYIYAYLLGAGGTKVELILGLPEGYGNKVKDLFTQRTPGLAELRARLKKEVKKTGRIKNIDGRLFHCDDPHFALAFILQGYEQTIMKMVGVRLYDLLRSRKNLFGSYMVAWVHDEYQIEVEDIEAPSEYWITTKDGSVLKNWPEIVGQETVEIIEAVGRELKLTCFLTGEAKIGNSWLDSH